MKRIFKNWTIALLTGSMMGACSTEGITDIDNNGLNTNEATYIAVNLRNVLGTRVEATFDDGTEAESKVTNIAFYFFDDSGNSVQVSSDRSNLRTIDNTNFTLEGSTDDNITSSANTTIYLNGINSKNHPTKMVTIINPPSSLNLSNKKLSELKNEIADYATDLTSEGKFMMSSSVYADGDHEVCTTDITDKFFPTKEEAEEMGNGVDVYVERIVAKVTLSFDSSCSFDETNKVYKIDGIEDGLYFQLCGWYVADYNTKSHLLKNITPSWKDEELGFSATGDYPWTDANLHRSFWANSVAINATNPAGNNSWNTIATNNGTVYPQELASQTAITSETNNGLTKVIVAGKLVKKNGSAYEDAPRYTFLGTSYKSEDDILTAMCSHKEFPKEYYVMTGTNTYKSLSQENLKFTTPTDLGMTTGTRYQVFPQINVGTDGNIAGAIDGKVYTKSGSAYTAAANLDDVNNQLKELDAMIWKSGMTYYYATIKHLGDEGKPAEYGVVRNHWYDINVKSIKGYGTPVYDPEEIIIPEKPQDKYYLSVQITVLPWRVIENEVII